MVYPLAAAITSFAICFLIIPLVIKYSLKKNIVDIPGKRRIHKKVTPSMGGVAIFFAFLITSLIWIDQWQEVRIILISLVMIFFIGVRDDLIPLKPITKIVGQIMAAFILVQINDFGLKSMYGLLGVYEIPQWTSYLITIFTLVVITNSFNLIDGLDGLAGTIGSIALLCFGVWFFLVGDFVFAILTFSMLGALLAFLIFNWEPSKVFMGDTGAMVVGMMLAITTIHFIDYNYNLPATHSYRFTPSIATAICFMIIPLADTMRIVVIRLARKRSPFSADKSHIHHSIMRLGFSHSATTLILGFVQLMFIGFAILFNDANDNYVLLGILLLTILLSLLLDRLLLSRLTKEPKIEAVEMDAG